MNRQEQEILTRAMSGLAAAEKAIVPPPTLESALLAEFDAANPSRRRLWIPMVGAGAIAAILACFALFHSPAPPPIHALARPAHIPMKLTPAVGVIPLPRTHQAIRRPRPRAGSAAPPADSNPFIAVPFTLPLGPNEPVAVMRVTMPVSALVSLGLVSAVADPTAIAPAEVVVSEDGRIRALRLISEFNSEEKINP